MEFEEPKTLGYCDDCWSERQNHRYVIVIDPPSWGDEYKYDYSFSKNYGDYCGSGGEVKSKEALMNCIKRIIELWESYDSIVGRNGNKVTRKNLFFHSFTDNITKMEVLGNRKLTEF